MGITGRCRSRQREGAGAALSPAVRPRRPTAPGGQRHRPAPGGAQPPRRHREPRTCAPGGAEPRPPRPARSGSGRRRPRSRGGARRPRRAAIPRPAASRRLLRAPRAACTDPPPPGPLRAAPLFPAPSSSSSFRNANPAPQSARQRRRAPAASRGSQARSRPPGAGRSAAPLSPRAGLPRGAGAGPVPGGSSAPPGAPRLPPPAPRLSLRGGDGCQQITSRPRREREIYTISPPHVLGSLRSDVEGLRERRAPRRRPAIYSPPRHRRGTRRSPAAAEVPHPGARRGEAEKPPEPRRKSESCQAFILLLFKIKALVLLAPIIKSNWAK
ncbi:proline-rich protein 2-like [Sylvia atricapilla]|uniref:proline-rich protein 2-like n=1 Tax=Sylvia atricapilla TaxID=48155 RepID=UPI003396CCA8